MQKSRFDDQRTNFPKTPRLPPLNEQFFDQLAKCQVRFKNSKKKKTSIFIFILRILV